MHVYLKLYRKLSCIRIFIRTNPSYNAHTLIVLFCRCRYAVERLSAADDSELLSYLLQLVQALRYEVSYDNDNDYYYTMMNNHSMLVFM